MSVTEPQSIFQSINLFQNSVLRCTMATWQFAWQNYLMRQELRAQF